ncbi:glycosyltransferase family 2 protein [Sphingomonas sp. URHD0057]|uniref:glycosyltransferase family 2 protein n=1 Tax=Sphingomonas sp. URHD0057 TaxID=1380389 RepID=UPI00048E4A05|nr:glycosyltransferase family 2 protein [Sphingomonas sp. URHD0057]
MTSDCILSIIVPVKDEEQAVAPFVERVSEVLKDIPELARGHYEILFVDDGSDDATLDAIRQAHAGDRHVRAVSFSRNFGKEAALTAGLEHARGQAVVPMDVDLQDPPEVLPQMIEKWRAGFEIVYGVRSDRASDSLPKRLTADLYYRAHNWLSNDKIPVHAGDFRLLDRKVVDAILRMPERNRFMKGMFAWAGFRQTSVPYSRPARASGSSKFNYWKLWTFALDGITSSSTVPLRVWSYLGGLVALFALAYAIFIAVRTVAFGNDVPGYASLMVSVLFLGGLQLLSLGVLGEYVGRILTETKARPLYIIREQIGEDD